MYVNEVTFILAAAG